MGDDGSVAAAAARGQLWSIVLASGEGVRLRSLARRVCGDERPKQCVRAKPCGFLGSVRWPGRIRTLALAMMSTAFLLANTSASATPSPAGPVFPVVLVHGWGGSADTWSGLSGRLVGRSWINGGTVTSGSNVVFNADFYAVQFSNNRTLTFDEQAIELAAIIAQVLGATGAERVILVTHSMGGLAARQYLEFHDPGQTVAALITVGAPHLGIADPSVLESIVEFGRCGEFPGDFFTANYKKCQNVLRDLETGSTALDLLNSLGALARLPSDIVYTSIIGLFSQPSLGIDGDGVVSAESQDLGRVVGTEGLSIQSVPIEVSSPCNVVEVHSCEPDDVSIQDTIIAGIEAVVGTPPSGSIAASPNPCTIVAGSTSCTSAITWTTDHVTHAEVYVSSGGTETRVWNATACSGQSCSAPWIRAGGPFTFMLYDYSTGARGATLGSVVVTAQVKTPAGSIVASPNPCPIVAGASACTAAVAWSTQNVTQARVYVSVGGSEVLVWDSTACAGQTCSASWIQPATVYTFTLYDYSTGARGATLGSVVITAEGKTPAGSIAASPNPCTIVAGPAACTAAIAWSTQNVTQARVYVSVGGTEFLVWDSTACTGQTCSASWIQPATIYTFTLYDYSTGARGANLGSVSVTATGVSPTAVPSSPPAAATSASAVRLSR